MLDVSTWNMTDCPAGTISVLGSRHDSPLALSAVHIWVEELQIGVAFVQSRSERQPAKASAAASATASEPVAASEPIAASEPPEDLLPPQADRTITNAKTLTLR